MTQKNEDKKLYFITSKDESGKTHYEYELAESKEEAISYILMKDAKRKIEKIKYWKNKNDRRTHTSS